MEVLFPARRSMPPKSSLTLALIIFGLAAPGTAADSRKAAAPIFPELAKYKGKVVLLNFWATTCGRCLIEIPWFMKFENNYKAGGVTVLRFAPDQNGAKTLTPSLLQRNLN